MDKRSAGKAEMVGVVTVVSRTMTKVISFEDDQQKGLTLFEITKSRTISYRAV